MKILIFGAIVVAHHASASVDSPRFLWAIQQVEAHRWADPGGALGISRITWRQWTRLPYSYASNPDYAVPLAIRHMEWLERSLKADGRSATVYELAGCWRLGLEGFKTVGRLDYAERVRNLYYDKL